MTAPLDNLSHYSPNGLPGLRRSVQFNLLADESVCSSLLECVDPVLKGCVVCVCGPSEPLTRLNA